MVLADTSTAPVYVHFLKANSNFCILRFLTTGNSGDGWGIGDGSLRKNFFPRRVLIPSANGVLTELVYGVSGIMQGDRPDISLMSGDGPRLSDGVECCSVAIFMGLFTALGPGCSSISSSSRSIISSRKSDIPDGRLLGGDEQTES